MTLSEIGINVVFGQVRVPFGSASIGWIHVREYDAPEYHGSVGKAMVERGQFDAWVKGNALTRVVMPLNFERADIA